MQGGHRMSQVAGRLLLRKPSKGLLVLKDSRAGPILQPEEPSAGGKDVMKNRGWSDCIRRKSVLSSEEACSPKSVDLRLRKV